jgi:hypothetical protein
MMVAAFLNQSVGCAGSKAGGSGRQRRPSAQRCSCPVPAVGGQQARGAARAAAAGGRLCCGTQDLPAPNALQPSAPSRPHQAGSGSGRRSSSSSRSSSRRSSRSSGSSGGRQAAHRAQDLAAHVRPDLGLGCAAAGLGRRLGRRRGRRHGRYRWVRLDGCCCCWFGLDAAGGCWRRGPGRGGRRGAGAATAGGGVLGDCRGGGGVCVVGFRVAPGAGKCCGERGASVGVLRPQASPAGAQAAASSCPGGLVRPGWAQLRARGPLHGLGPPRRATAAQPLRKHPQPRPRRRLAAAAALPGPHNSCEGGPGPRRGAWAPKRGSAAATEGVAGAGRCRGTCAALAARLGGTPCGRRPWQRRSAAAGPAGAREGAGGPRARHW